MEKLNSRIDFISTEILINENGFQVDEIEELYYTCWCNVKVLSFKEFYASATTNSKQVLSFRCRYCNKLKDIDSLIYKIKYKDKLYNIIYIKSSEGFIDFKGELING